jgi:hypothetical protein
MITLASSNPDTPAYTEEIPCTDSVPCEIAAEDIPVQMELDHEWQKKRPSPQEEGEGRITYLEIRIAYARKSPPAHSSNAHYGRISHHGRSG